MAKKSVRKKAAKKKAKKRSARKAAPCLPMCRCLTCGEWFRQPESYMHHPKLDCPPCDKKRSGR